MERYLEDFDLIVSTDGTVQRICPQSSHGHRKGELYQLNPLVDKKGYLYVGYTKNGKTVRAYVHRLVAIAFVPNPNRYTEVDHINRVRDDNRVENLRWASRKMQCDNSAKALNRVDYGVRACEDKAAYQRARYEKDPEYREKRKAAMAKRRTKKKEATRCVVA